MPYIRVPKLSGSHPLVLANAVQVKLRWTYNNIEGVNVLAGRHTGGYTNSQAHADSLATAVGTAFNDSGLQARMATSTTLRGVGIRDVRAANLVEFVSDTINMDGTGSASSLPNQLAAVVTLRTAFAGKSYRGRLYFSGGDEDQNEDDGTILSFFNLALVDFVTRIRTAMTTEGLNLAVLSAPRFANLPPPADVETWPGAINDVVAGGIQTRDVQWDTQRRRKT